MSEPTTKSLGAVVQIKQKVGHFGPNHLPEQEYLVNYFYKFRASIESPEEPSWSTAAHIGESSKTYRMSSPFIHHQTGSDNNSLCGKSVFSLS